MLRPCLGPPSIIPSLPTRFRVITKTLVFSLPLASRQESVILTSFLLIVSESASALTDDARYFLIVFYILSHLTSAPLRRTITYYLMISVWLRISGTAQDSGQDPQSGSGRVANIFPSPDSHPDYNFASTLQRLCRCKFI